MSFDLPELETKATLIEESGAGPTFREEIEPCKAKQLTRIADTLERIEKLAKEKT